MTPVDIICEINEINKQMMSKEGLDYATFHRDVMDLVYEIKGQEIQKIFDNLNDFKHFLEVLDEQI